LTLVIKKDFHGLCLSWCNINCLGFSGRLLYLRQQLIATVTAASVNRNMLDGSGTGVLMNDSVVLKKSGVVPI
jgi:hypothetical protein